MKKGGKGAKVKRKTQRPLPFLYISKRAGSTKRGGRMMVMDTHIHTCCLCSGAKVMSCIHVSADKKDYTCNDYICIMLFGRVGWSSEDP